MLKALNALNKFGRILDSEKESREPFEILFLLGAPRSNTTLIHRLLCLHDEMAAPELREILFPGKAGGLLRTAMGIIPESVYHKLYNPDIHETNPMLAEADDLGIMARFGEGLFAWAYEGAMKEQEFPTITKEHLYYLHSFYQSLQQQKAGKLPVSKYFSGVYQFDDLRVIFPQGKFVLLLRNPEQVVYSVSTLIGTALSARKIKIRNPDIYWGRLYRFMVKYYEQIAWLIEHQKDELLIIPDEKVKNNLFEVMEMICNYSTKSFDNQPALQQQVEMLSTRVYSRKYDYLKVMDEFYDKNDFKKYNTINISNRF